MGLPEPVAEYRFHTTRRWRFDYAWPQLRLALEVDGGAWVGGRHTRGAGYEKDCEKLNAALLAGWRVLRFTTGMVQDGRALAVLQEALR
jgi:very-short-patch-repair endonuclease